MLELSTRMLQIFPVSPSVQDDPLGLWNTSIERFGTTCVTFVGSLELSLPVFDSPPPATVAVSVTINADPPGPDNEHLDEEWVRFRNDGPAALDLTGWTVADESSSNRYTFADLVLAPGATVTLYTGCGTDTDAARYWCSDGFPIWNNDGDTVFLRDRSGTDVIAQGY